MGPQWNINYSNINNPKRQLSKCQINYMFNSDILQISLCFIRVVINVWIFDYAYYSIILTSLPPH